MTNFRFAVMGAGNIANKFCDAVNRIADCEVAAVASKSMERAQAFARKNGLKAAYDLSLIHILPVFVRHL